MSLCFSATTSEYVSIVFLENPNVDEYLTAGTTLFIRCQTNNNISENVAIDLKYLEKIYCSSIIEQVHFMSIVNPLVDDHTQSKEQLTAIIVSESHEVTVLEDLERTAISYQLKNFQIPTIVLIQRNSLYGMKESEATLLEGMERHVLEKQYRTKIMNALLTYENPDGIFFKNKEEENSNSNTADLLIEQDKILDPMLIQPSTNKSESVVRKDIFLTGSSGFLGGYLLDELLKQTDANIYCLVRSRKSTNVSSTRVSYLQGDLSLPRFGLKDSQYSMLTSNICSIYHCGAMISFIQSYKEHRAANVLGTLEIIKLAYLSHCRINYISTLSVFEENERSGYIQSKQVAECLLTQASQKGLNVTILRPGKIYNTSIAYISCIATFVFC